LIKTNSYSQILSFCLSLSAAQCCKLFTCLLFSYLIGSNHAFGQQDPLSSQLFTNLLNLNPAYAGSSENIHAGLGYRNQWPELGNAYINYSAYYDQPVDLVHGGFGINISDDRQGAGLFNRLQASFIYSYEIQLQRYFTFNLGLESALVNNSMNLSGIVLPDMISGNGLPTEVINTGTHSYPDFSFGAIGSYRNHYFGFAVHHLFTPLENPLAPGVIKLARKFSLLAGTNIELSSDNPTKSAITLSPAVYADYQNKFLRLVYGSYISYSSVFLGLWLKHQLTDIGNSAISFHIGYSFSIVRLCYSFDYLLLSSAGLSHSGIHEVSLSFRFPHEAKRKKIQAIKCPKI
jgi:type IX secretion system PorP/SprF family membrane protein